MSDHKLFTHGSSALFHPASTDSSWALQRCPPRGTRHLLLLTWVQRAADAAATSKAPEGPLKDPGLSQSIYFHRFGRRQTSPTPLYALVFSGSDKGPPTLPPRWHHSTQRKHQRGQPGLWSGLHHKDSKSQQKQLCATTASPLARPLAGLIQIKCLSLLWEAL